MPTPTLTTPKKKHRNKNTKTQKLIGEQTNARSGEDFFIFYFIFSFKRALRWETFIWVCQVIVTFEHMWVGALWRHSGIMHSGILPIFSRYYSSLTFSGKWAWQWIGRKVLVRKKVEQGQTHLQIEKSMEYICIWESSLPNRHAQLDCQSRLLNKQSVLWISYFRY